MTIEIKNGRVIKKIIIPSSEQNDCISSINLKARKAIKLSEIAEIEAELPEVEAKEAELAVIVAAAIEEKEASK